MQSLNRILENVARMKRIYRAAYCPDGWQTIEEYDDCMAILRGRSILVRDEAHERKLAQRRAYRQRKGTVTKPRGAYQERGA